MDIKANSDSRFQHALLNPELAPPDGVSAWNAETGSKRFDVYRNNVIVSLIDALANSFNVVKQLVGEPFFRAMAREFLRDPANLPASPVLAHYGERFPAFIAAFEPAATLPYLSDVAQLEWLRLQSLHAADANSADSKHLSTVVKKALSNETGCIPFKLFFHPSLALFDSRYAAVSIWAAHQGLAKLANIDPNTPEQALILRPELEVETIPLSHESADFIDRCMAGEPLRNPALGPTLELLVQKGAITGIALFEEE